jgi:SAM-dependent methyltransferase
MTDYEQQFRKCRNACGEPFPEFVRFFEEYPGDPGTVLDLGCGQGRDALLAASHGHSVVGVDFSPTGVSQMQQAAAARGLAVEGVVADVVSYRPRRKHGIVILDRVLHMLPSEEDRVWVLRSASRATRLKGYVLIADTPRHQAADSDLLPE